MIDRCASFYFLFQRIEFRCIEKLSQSNYKVITKYIDCQQLENVPRQFAIERANLSRIEIRDSVICYSYHIGNTRTLLEHAQHREKKIEKADFILPFFDESLLQQSR